MLFKLSTVYTASALLLYVLLSWHFARHWSDSTGRRYAHMPRLEYSLIGVVLLLHAATLNYPEGQWFTLGVGQAASWVAWLTLLIYWLSTPLLALEGLQLPLLALGSLGLLLGVSLPSGQVAYDLAQPVVTVHIALSLLAYSLFTLATFTALLMLWLERRLHARKLLNLEQPFLPLLTLEHRLFQLLFTGFVLLTLTMSSGIVFSEQLFGKPFAFTHKTLFSIASWIIFAGLLLGRHRHGWRGKTAARWTLGGGILLLLAYFGSQVVLELMLYAGL